MAQKKINRKTKKHVWFTPMRGSYLPASWQGWLTYVPFTAYLVFAAIAGWQEDTVAKTVLFVVPNWVAAVVVMTWVAKAKS